MKNDPRKFRARENLISFSRVMALVMGCRSVVSRQFVDTQSSRVQPFLHCELLQLDVFRATRPSSPDMAQVKPRCLCEGPAGPTSKNLFPLEKTFRIQHSKKHAHARTHTHTNQPTNHIIKGVLSVVQRFLSSGRKRFSSRVHGRVFVWK